MHCFKSFTQIHTNACNVPYYFIQSNRIRFVSSRVFPTILLLKVFYNCSGKLIAVLMNRELTAIVKQSYPRPSNNNKWIHLFPSVWVCYSVTNVSIIKYQLSWIVWQLLFKTDLLVRNYALKMPYLKVTTPIANYW